MRIKLWYIPELIFNEIFSQVNTMEGVWIRLSWMYPSQTTVQIYVLVPLWETSQTSVVWWLLKILSGGKSSFSRRITFTLSSWCHIKRKLNNLLFIFFSSHHIKFGNENINHPWLLTRIKPHPGTLELSKLWKYLFLNSGKVERKCEPRESWD